MAVVLGTTGTDYWKPPESESRWAPLLHQPRSPPPSLLVGRVQRPPTMRTTAAWFTRIRTLLLRASTGSTKKIEHTTLVALGIAGKIFHEEQRLEINELY